MTPPNDPPIPSPTPAPTGPDARYPVALLPVRIETRFSGTQLKVRIFPDEIFADTHEPGLTADEARDGAAYVATIGTAGEARAWGALVGRYQAPRAAWIALASAKGSPTARAESWTRAAQALLPQRWIVRAYRGAQTFTVTIDKVAQPLALTVSPAPGPQVTISDGLTVDADLEWTLHFDAAVTAGMAVTIDLTKPDGQPTPGPIPVTPPPPPVVAPQPILSVPPPAVDVVVVGVRDQTPDAGSAELRALFDAHHYTRGLAFIAPGTPTSNSPSAPAGFPVDDPAGAHSFAVERQAPLATPGDGSDGAAFARALGLAPAAGEQLAAVEHVEGAARAQDAVATAMNGALWPATLGYFMQQMMAPRFDAATIEAARQYFLANVRPGGPLPSLRVGRVPYGLLPVVSLTRYAPDSALSQALRVLRNDHFVPAAAKMPRVAPWSADPDGDLLKALAVDASSRQVRIRTLLGEDVTRNSAGLFGVDGAFDILQRARAVAATTLLGTLGLGADTRMGHMDPGAVTDLLGTPMVTSGPLSETTGVGYIQTLIDWASASPPDFASIRDDKLPGFARPLLYRVLRHALLLEMDRISTTLPIGIVGPIVGAVGHLASAAAHVDLAEPELVNLGAAKTATAFDRITAVLHLPTFPSQLGPYLGYLKTLAALPSAELDRRFTETLDACSHRLEAWITSLATARLWSMRAAAPTGCHVGAFGWVEGVRPAAATASAPQGGFIHAPSATHASTAAILRNGYLSRGGGGSPYAVDLGSARARAALELLDGTRQGESLSALLGYRFERALHDRNLDKLVASLRGQFPLVAGRTPDGGGPVELVAAGSVVDGLALRAAQPAPPAGLSTTEAANFTQALQLLDDAVDGLADLLTAESVFQAVRGNPTTAAAGLDAMAQGLLPPDVDVVRTPVGGATFTQRLVVALDGTVAAPTGATPRAAAEPALDAWAARLLGDWSTVGCRVLGPDGKTTSVRLDSLGLRPLDLLALAKTPPSGLGDGELDRRVLAHAGAAAGSRVQYDATDVAHSFADWLELARVVGALVAGARPLSAADLVAPADAPNAAVTAATATDAATRARHALAALHAAALTLGAALAPVAAAVADSSKPPPTSTQLAALRAALQAAAAFGVAGAWPSAAANAAELATLAAGVAAELASRQAKAPALTSADPSTLLAAAVDTITAVFGRDFVFLPRVAPSEPTTLAAALTEAPALVGDANLPRQVLQQMARVRPGLGRWRAAFLYVEALATASQTLEVAQLPTGQPAWAATKNAAPANGTLSLLLHRPTQAAPTKTWAGLVIDEWNELIPAASQPTAIAFRHETPVAEAPQAVLLAVPPTSAAVWDQNTLIDTVREALTLAKVRLVDTIDDLRPFLPAICLTGNTANETVSTDFLPYVVADPIIRKSI